MRSKDIEQSNVTGQATLNDPLQCQKTASSDDLMVDAFKRGDRVAFTGNAGCTADARHKVLVSAVNEIPGDQRSRDLDGAFLQRAGGKRRSPSSDRSTTSATKTSTVRAMLTLKQAELAMAAAIRRGPLAPCARILGRHQLANEQMARSFTNLNAADAVFDAAIGAGAQVGGISSPCSGGFIISPGPARVRLGLPRELDRFPGGAMNFLSTGVGAPSPAIHA